MLMQPSIAVVGALGYDAICTAAGASFRGLGGSAAYAALAAAPRARVSLLSAVGEDFRQEDRDVLQRQRIDLSHVATISGKASFSWAATYSSGGDSRETTHFDMGAFDDFSPVWPDDLSVDAVQMGSIPPTMQLSIVETMPAGIPFAFDTFPHWIDSQRSLIETLLQKAAVITVNAEEASLITGRQSPAEAAQALLASAQPRVLIVKDGSKGAHCFTEAFNFHVPAAPIGACIPETTGAGDSFAGAFLSHWAASRSTERDALRDSMEFAASVAAAAVSAPGIDGLLSLNARSCENDNS
jgi:sugar/nucleoside kinase (ribokinase family)